MYLSFDEIVEIHSQQISRYGGESGFLNRGNLDFIADMQDRFTDPLEIAAFLLYNIATLHPFCDGNKRTAYVAAGIILCESGFDFLVSEEEEERFVLSVANCNENFESVTQWLKKMTEKREFTY